MSSREIHNNMPTHMKMWLGRRDKGLAFGEGKRSDQAPGPVTGSWPQAEPRSGPTVELPQTRKIKRKTKIPM